MTKMRWDPDRYLEFAGPRARPFVELVHRIDAAGAGRVGNAGRVGRVGRVVDLGCGPGNLTALLGERWPDAEITGVDSSVEMVDRATSDLRTHHGRIDFAVGDIRTWRAEQPVDVLVSNAALQWVPGHLDLLPRLLDQVASGGWFAFQVPGNFAEPSHRLLAETAAEEPYASYTRDVEQPASHDAATYLTALADLGCSVDAWETTYLHVLQGSDPVFDWISGTGARPILQALPDGLRSQFEEQFKTKLREAYPPRRHGVVLPFRRVFAVAQRP